MNYKEKYDLWLSSNIVDENTKKELKKINDEKEIEDRFYKELEFGTGGLRGVIGAGSNRMNVYTVGKATQGLAEYLIEQYGEDASVAIAYDSRNMSREFAEVTAKVLCANNVKAYLFESLRPTPMLSFAVSHLKTKAGIVITASHNPKQYNGYKVYGEYGGQITDNAAKAILDKINAVDSFEKIKTSNKDKSKEHELLTIIGEEVDKAYYEKVKALTIRKDLVKEYAKELNIIYTPIHGSGNVPVRRVLSELGYENVKVVKEQELPDGNFTTAPYPNPEEKQVFNLALEMAKSENPDLIFGTDPDCDRIGLVVRDNEGNYRVLTGNQTGVLLTHYIVSSLKERNELPSNGAIIKTIVTTDMAEKICEEFNVELMDVLTGFKYIGEMVHQFESDNSHKFLFGFEESYGYLSGDFVKDKDAVIAATLACEMTLYYKKKGLSLYDALIELYNKYGCYKEKLVSIELKGKEGQEKIFNTIEYLRHSMNNLVASYKIKKKMDYKLSIEKDLINIQEKEIQLPKSNVLKFILEDDSWFVVRPSGTEPKMKIYLSSRGENIESTEKRLEVLTKDVMDIINKACE